MKTKNLIIIFVIIFFICFLTFGLTYSFILSKTNSGVLNTGSGNVSIDYKITKKFEGNLKPTLDKEHGIRSTITAKLSNGSAAGKFNLYLTPNISSDLNIEAFKWELITTGKEYTNFGNFKTSVNDTPIKIVDSLIFDDQTEVTFDIYIWLDASLLDTPIGSNTKFDAKITADAVTIEAQY